MFYSYTESIYALLVFSSLYYLTTNNFIFSLLSLFFATFTRSNGILLCGFILFRFFYSFFLNIFTYCASLLPSKNASTRKGKLTSQFWNKISTESAHAETRFSPITKILLTILFCTVTLAPYLGFQFYGKLQFCSLDPTARPWCNHWIPNLYSFVQTFYW